MAITRINNFEAKAGFEQALYEFFQGVISAISQCEGCLGCQLLRSIDNPAVLVIVEQWVDVESHQCAASAIPPEQLQTVLAMFATPPVGTYYSA